MAEGFAGSSPPSDDSLSEDESSYLLNFDLPDNDQTWLYCFPGDDPNIVVDLTEWLNIRPSFMASHSPFSEASEPKSGHVIDTRTYTRPKKQNVLGHGKTSQKHNIVDDELIKKSELSPSSKLPFLSAAAKELREGKIPSLKNEYAKMQQNKENLNLSPNSNNNSRNEQKIMKKSTRLSDEITLLENVSYPQSFFSDLTLSETCMDSERSENISYPNQCSAQHQYNLNTTYEKPNEFKSDLSNVHSVIDNQLHLSMHQRTPPKDDKSKGTFTFLPPLVSTPNTKGAGIRNVPDFILTPEVKKKQISKSRLDLENQSKEHHKIQSTKVNEIDDSLNNNVANLDETFVKNDDKPCTMKYMQNEGLETGSLLNRTLVIGENSQEEKMITREELTSHDSTFLVNMITGPRLTIPKDKENLLIDKESNFLPPISTEARLKTHDANIVIPSKLWAEKKAKSDKEIESRPDSCYSSSSNVRSVGDICTIAQEQEDSLPITREELSTHNSTFLVNMITIPRLTIPKDKENLLIDKESNFLPPISTEARLKTHDANIVIPSKLWAESNTNSNDKEIESRPDSCYSSSSNIRSIGDICAIAQEQEDSLKYNTFRKSVSHDSLLSLPDSSCIGVSRKHESTSNLSSCSNIGTGLKKPGFSLRPDARDTQHRSIPTLKPKSNLPRGGRSLQKPVCNVKKNETINRQTNVAEGNPSLTQKDISQKDKKPSGIKPPTVLSRIPRVTKIPKPSIQSRPKSD